VRVLFLNAPAFGGPAGFAGIPAATTLWHVLGLLAVLVYFFARVSGSRIGRAFAALRDDEAAAEAMGVNSTYVKLAAFAVAGATILSILPELLRWVKDWREILYGLLVLAMMLVRPQGLLDVALLARLSPRGERAAARG